MTSKKWFDVDISVVCKLLYGLAFLHIVLMLFVASKQSIWLDEVYTLRFIQFPFRSLRTILAEATTPPFYYFYVKAVAEILMSAAPVSVVTAAKIASVLPIIGLVIAAKLKAAKNWGELCGAFFAFSVTAMPLMLRYATEIRMYSLALLFAGMSFLYAWDAAVAPKFANFALLALFSALSAYTHFFATLTIMFIYMSLAGWYLVTNRKMLSKCFLSGLCVFVSYLPWLANTLKVVKSVSGSFWLGEITLTDFLSFGIFPFRVPAERSEIVSSTILMMICAVVVLRFCLKCFAGKEQTFYFGLSAIALLPAVVLTGVLVSYLIRPIFTARYMIPALGVFWLGFSIALTHKSQTASQARKHALMLTILSIVVIDGLGNSLFARTESKNDIADEYTSVTIFNKTGENDAVIVDDLVSSMFFYHFTNAQTVYSYPNSLAATEMQFFPNISSIPDLGSFKNAAETHDEVWCYFTSRSTLYEAAKYFRANGIDYEILGDYTYGWYSFTVCKLL